MSDVIDAALVRRYIGRTLKALRGAKGLSIKHASELADVGTSTLERVERGDRVRLKSRDLAAILQVYESDEETTALLLALAAESRNGKDRPWYQDRTEDIPGFFGEYVMLESSAERIRAYEFELFHGLLQMPAYTEAILSVNAGRFSTEEIRQRIDIRTQRQTLLTKGRAPRLEVILNEAVLRRVAGSPAVMIEQLDHLLTVSRWGNVSVRILPFSAGLHAGVTASAPFTLLDFPVYEPSGVPFESPLAYVDALAGALYLQKPEQITVYEMVWKDLESRALDETASQEMVRATMEGLQHD
ncbi:helix-turn-helix domain-containing protein [Actinoplanes sp. HUAS TT8]|uniref:helix-turn-helix domain-containing protein n=1 Tax=Actinoplanes sp. HUAS TT8 TaxID=3447453 RepID=UPI003F522B90